MAFFKNLFGNKGDEPASEPAKLPEIRFGRYTDSNKIQYQRDEYEKANNAFKEKKYVESFRHFFEYLNDKALSNVSYTQESDGIKFQLVQGSKIVKGMATEKSFVAEANIASFDSPSVPAMRKLMQMNYGLKYCCFAINGNMLCMKFTSSSIDASPAKLYFALKELATSADKQDDLLISEFQSLHQVESAPSEPVPAHIVDIKYKFFKKWLDETIEKASKLDEDKFSGAIAYLWLNLAYKIDFLLAPEGVLTNAIEKIQFTYFNPRPDGSKPTTIELNRLLAEQYEKIRNIPEDDIRKSFYNVKSTFAIAAPANFQQIADFVFNESKNINWYFENYMDDIVVTIYQYITGYSLFNYGLNPVLTDIFKLYLHISHNDYFKELGFKQEFMNGTVLNQQAIVSEIQKIIAQGKKDYPHLSLLTTSLNFKSLSEFSITYFKEFDFLNFTK